MRRHLEAPGPRSSPSPGVPSEQTSVDHDLSYQNRHKLMVNDGNVTQLASDPLLEGTLAHLWHSWAGVVDNLVSRFRLLHERNLRLEEWHMAPSTHANLQNQPK